MENIWTKVMISKVDEKIKSLEGKTKKVPESISKLEKRILGARKLSESYIPILENAEFMIKNIKKTINSIEQLDRMIYDKSKKKEDVIVSYKDIYNACLTTLKEARDSKTYESSDKNVDNNDKIKKRVTTVIANLYGLNHSVLMMYYDMKNELVKSFDNKSKDDIKNSREKIKELYNSINTIPSLIEGSLSILRLL